MEGLRCRPSPITARSGSRSWSRCRVHRARAARSARRSRSRWTRDLDRCFREDRVGRWRVYEGTVENRARIGVEMGYSTSGLPPRSEHAQGELVRGSAAVRSGLRSSRVLDGSAWAAGALLARVAGIRSRSSLFGPGHELDQRGLGRVDASRDFALRAVAIADLGQTRRRRDLRAVGIAGQIAVASSTSAVGECSCANASNASAKPFSWASKRAPL